MRAEIEKYLKQGGVIIGEQKFTVECDSCESQILYSLAADYGVPILLHFQHGTYNLGFDRFHKMLEKFPNMMFIGHVRKRGGRISTRIIPIKNFFTLKAR